jgi:hypothetical protein
MATSSDLAAPLLVVDGFGCQKDTMVPIVVGFGIWPSRQKPMTMKPTFAFIVSGGQGTYVDYRL